MVFERGGIYLASLYPSKGDEVGKTRPVLVLQTDMLNSVNHSTTIILPLSTVIINDAYPLRFDVKKKDKLKEDSQILCDQIRTIDNRRLTEDKLTHLSHEDLISIEQQVQMILEFN